MKKYFTTISLQFKDLTKQKYKAIDNPKLQYDAEYSFPILAAINSDVEAGETIEIVPLLIKNDTQGNSTNNNYKIFEQQLEELAKAKNFKYTIQDPIYKSEDDSCDTLIKTFSEIIRKVNDGDILHACLTYGTKPVSTLMLMALHYAYRVKKDIDVKTIVYGCIHWNVAENNIRTGVGEIYDVTPMFYIDMAVDKLAALNLKDPEKVLTAMLSKED